VALLAAVAHFRLEFKDDYLVAAAVLLGCDQHPGSLDKRLADGDIGAVTQEQYLIQLNRAAFGCFQPLDVYRLPFGYPVLLSACFNYRVNFRPPR